MGKNYYEILGIPQNATINDILMAYRVLAKKHHPDLGGSHEEMVELNEAWEIISRPNLRQAYDYALNNKNDIEAQYSAKQNSSSARDNAAQYPRKWSAFEFWLNGITKDFSNAEYDTFSGPGSIPLPTAGKSFSGWLFIIAGVVTGAFIAAFFMKFFNIDSRGIVFKVLGVIFLAIGGWVGLIVHAYFGKILLGEERDLNQ